jgi:hypothetical protein
MKIRIQRYLNGTVSIHATLTEGDITVIWSTRCFSTAVADGVKDAKAGALKAMAAARGTDV